MYTKLFMPVYTYIYNLLVLFAFYFSIRLKSNSLTRCVSLACVFVFMCVYLVCATCVPDCVLRSTFIQVFSVCMPMYARVFYFTPLILIRDFCALVIQKGV